MTKAPLASDELKMTNGETASTLQQFNDRAIEAARQGDLKENVAQLLLQRAIRDATFGGCANVNTTTQQALALSREQAKVVAAATALATCGQAAPAQSLIDELIKRFPEDTLVNTIFIPISRAQIELGRGNAAQALQLLDPARRYVPTPDATGQLGQRPFRPGVDYTGDKGKEQQRKWPGWPVCPAANNL